jgi:hypothetical protein
MALILVERFSWQGIPVRSALREKARFGLVWIGEKCV